MFKLGQQALFLLFCLKLERVIGFQPLRNFGLAFHYIFLFHVPYQDLDALEWNTSEDRPEGFVDAAVSKSGRTDVSSHILSHPFSRNKTRRVFDGSYQTGLAIYHQYMYHAKSVYYYDPESGQRFSLLQIDPLCHPSL